MRRSTILAACMAASTLMPMGAHAQQGFDSYNAAAEAIVQALRDRSVSQLLAVFGEENEDLLLTGDPEEDRENWGAFLAAYESETAFLLEPDGRTFLLVGENDWSFPIPMVLKDGMVFFDADAGREELLIRDIGSNELDMIEVLARYVAAQAEYRAMDPDGDGVHSFAAHLISEEGKTDGLYWPGGESPVGDVFASASLAGYITENGEELATPFAGYYFHMLQGQGDAAPGGAMDYSVNGHQLAGHALIAVPEVYGITGVMSFMVAESGTIYEADLGEESVAIAFDMTLFNPTEDWTVVTD